MDDHPVNIISRDYDEDHDSAVIITTWRNSAFYLSAFPHKDENEVFFRKFTRKIKNILKHATVKIACLEDCPMVIIGYCVYTGDHLDWIYVKGGPLAQADYRKMGIATMLFPKEIKTVTADLTKIGLSICQTKNLTIKGD